MTDELLDAESGFDLDELRKTQFSSDDGTIVFSIEKMPSTTAFKFLNAIRAEMGRSDRATNAMSTGLTVINVLENKGNIDPSAIGGAELARMAQSFFSMIFGLSEHFVDEVVRYELSRCIRYRSQRLTGGEWMPLWEDPVDNTDEVTDDWAFLMEIMARSFVVNFTGSSRLRAWMQKAEQWTSSPSKPSESTP